MRIILTAIFAISLLTAKSQKSAFAPVTVTVKCHKSLGYLTNVPGEYDLINFTFENEDEATLFWVENFTHQNYINLVRNNDTKSLARVKLLLPGYEVKPYDFVFCYSKNQQLQYYYIVKDQQEEKMLQKSSL